MSAPTARQRAEAAWRSTCHLSTTPPVIAAIEAAILAAEREAEARGLEEAARLIEEMAAEEPTRRGQNKALLWAAERLRAAARVRGEGG